MKRTDAAVFVVVFWHLLTEGVELVDALDETIRRVGFPVEHEACVQSEASLRFRRVQLERRHAREWSRLHAAIRFGGSTVEVARARASVNVVAEKLLNL